MRPIDVIRDLYPSPVREKDQYGDSCYCVGGALGLFYSTSKAILYPHRFPSPDVLALYLQSINPRLKWNTAWEMACAITDHNDNGRFDQAWDAANDALTYGR